MSREGLIKTILQKRGTVKSTSYDHYFAIIAFNQTFPKLVIASISQRRRFTQGKYYTFITYEEGARCGKPRVSHLSMARTALHYTAEAILVSRTFLAGSSVSNQKFGDSSEFVVASVNSCH